MNKYISRIRCVNFIISAIFVCNTDFNFFESIKYMAEKVEGSFSFSILDDRNNLYLVKGENGKGCCIDRIGKMF